MTNSGIHSYSNRQIRKEDGSRWNSFVGVLGEMVGSGARKSAVSRTISTQDSAGSKRMFCRLVVCHPTKGVTRRGFIFKSQQTTPCWG